MTYVWIFVAGAAAMLFGLIIAGRVHAWRRAQRRGKGAYGVNSVADSEETVVAVLKRDGEIHRIAPAPSPWPIRLWRRIRRLIGSVAMPTRQGENHHVA